MNSVQGKKEAHCIKKTTRRIAALTSLMIAAATGSWANAAELYGKVVGVTDGDTITVLDDMHRKHKIRLADIDAPETSCHSNRGNDEGCVERGQPFGKASKRSLSETVFGRFVTIDVQPGSTYGREIGTVYVVDGDNKIDANYIQVARGMAWHYTHFASKSQSPGEFARYSVAAKYASETGRGLWGEKAPIAPWDYRQARTESYAQPVGMK